MLHSYKYRSVASGADERRKTRMTVSAADAGRRRSGAAIGAVICSALDLSVGHHYLKSEGVHLDFNPRGPGLPYLEELRRMMIPTIARPNIIAPAIFQAL